ncbi:MAG: esterase/lipase family protein [Desulfovibrio sp.]|jgi:pimeloyl-ACP methyl ester carboxylesterase
MKHSPDMEIIVWILLFFVLVLPAVFYLVSIAANGLHGNLGRIRSSSGPLCFGLVRGWCNAAWATVLMAATYPLQRVLARRGSTTKEPETGSAAPVVLVHGLYHNHAAWWLFGRWLAGLGYGNLYTAAYGSFTREFPEAVQVVGRVVERALAENPGRKVLLCGHSLGGLVIRALLADERFRGRVAAVATLGTPHHGSLLGFVALGRLGRSLRPGSSMLQRLDALPELEDVPRLSFYTPLDNMVMPESCLRVGRPGWKEDLLPLKVSHVGMIYHRPLAFRVAAFFRTVEAGAAWQFQPSQTAESAERT